MEGICKAQDHSLEINHSFCLTGKLLREIFLMSEARGMSTHQQNDYIKCEMLLCKSNNYSNFALTKIISVTARMWKNSWGKKKTLHL